MQTGYDPTWRSFKGKTVFTPHPSALEAGQDLAWPHVYAPLDTKQPAAAAPDNAAAIQPAVPEAPLPVHPLVPDSAPDQGSPYPTSETASPRDGEAPPVDETVSSVPTPIPTAPAGKLATLYVRPETAVPPRPKRRGRPWAARPVGMASLAGAVVVAALIFVVIPKLLFTPPTLKTMFTAPMLVLRAVGPGSVTSVGVSIAQAVEPSTVLLTIHANPLSDAAVEDLKTRLAQARAREMALDALGAAPATSRQKDAAAAEVDQLQKAIAAAGGSGTGDQPILAGVRGIVWALDAQPGTRLKAGDPLAQLADCGRAFLVVQGATSALRAGQTVLIRMPDVRPFHGTVRPSSGVAEPQNTLVIDPTGFAAAAPNACPVGVTAEVQPETNG